MFRTNSLVVVGVVGLVTCLTLTNLNCSQNSDESAGEQGSGGGSDAAGAGGNSEGGSGGSNNAGAGGIGSGGTSLTGGSAGTAGSGGTTTGGTGGAPPDKGFRGCPAGAACKVMALGDDVAVGFFDTMDAVKGNPDQEKHEASFIKPAVVIAPSRAGYRASLLEALKQYAPTVAVTFVGSKSGPDSLPPAIKQHEGTSSALIADVTAAAPAALAAAKPNIIVVSAGAWDAKMNVDPTVVATRVGAMIDAIVTASPDALVVVLVPAPGHSLDSEYSKATIAYTVPFLTAIQARKTAGKHVVAANLALAFNTPGIGRIPGFGLTYVTGNPAGPCNDPTGGLLPNGLGYDWIAETVAKAISTAP